MEQLNAILIVLVITAAASGALIVVSSLHRRSFFDKVLRIQRVLPGLDCGVCGHAECIDFAEIAAVGGANVTGCLPGGPKTAHAIADILGTTVEVGEPMIAAVHCTGGTREARNRSRYDGIQDCHASILLGNGVKACPEGCLGLGSCVRACPFGALSINDNGVAIVDRHRCTGCGTCLRECPRGLIALIPHVHKIFLGCNSHAWGDAVLSFCTVGCTACNNCIESTPSGAITMVDHLPRLDYFTQGENFVAAVHSCPSHCFVDTIKVRPKANIDTKCDGCGACIGVCPVAGAIVGQSGQRHVVKKELCIGCGRCLNSCHVRAISLWGSLGYENLHKHKKTAP